jgi:hypothetical protein
VHEGQANYLKAAAEVYFHSTDDGKNLDRCLAVSPTWEENRLLTHEIRSALKERDLLPKGETPCTVHDSLRWTIQQRSNWRNYQPGQVVTFTKSVSGMKAGESATIERVEKGKVLLSGNNALPLKNAASFDVGMTRPIGVCPGDKILIRANQRSLGLINGQVVTVARIEADGTLHTREGIALPLAFKQWTHGYVVTSHKAQGRTCKRVVVAAARLDAKSAYVACSRGRELCSVHTPDKAALISQLPEGNRRAALDVLAANPRTDLSLQLRSTAYREIIVDIRRTHSATIRRTEQARQMIQRYNTERKRIQKAERIATPQQSVTPAERSRIDFTPIHSQRTGIGI